MYHTPLMSLIGEVIHCEGLDRIFAHRSRDRRNVGPRRPRSGECRHETAARFARTVGKHPIAGRYQPCATAVIVSAALILAGVRLDAQGPAETARAAVPPWDAKCLAVEVPEEVLTDQVFVGRITVQNTGTAPWRSIPYAGEPDPQPILYSQAPDRNKTWGTDFAYIGQGQEIGSGKEFTLVSGFKAPSIPGEYGFQWRLARRAKEGDTVFFGEPTLRKVIRVRPRPEAPRPVPSARDPRGKKVLELDDFQYAGSFRLPEKVGEGGAGFSEIGMTLRKMPDGTRRLLMNYTHPRQALFEVEIPAPAQFDGTDPQPLRVAEVTKVWGSLVLEIPKVGDLQQLSPNGGLWWDEDSQILYWTFYHGYWTGGGFPVLSASRLGDDGRITPVGRWRLPQSVSKWKSYWGGVTGLPAEFAQRHTGGRTMALGFGGYYSICAGCSRGPALAAIARPAPDRDELDIAELLCYPDPAAASRDGDYFYGLGNIWYDVPQGPDQGSWTMDDWCRSGVLIDLPEKQGYIAFVKLANGRIGYDYGAIGATGASHWWYFYDSQDLAAAAQGLKQPDQIVPHGMAKVSYPGQGAESLRQAQERGTVHVGGIAGHVSGACFDEQERLLYVCQLCSIRVGLELHPCVHVYRLK